MIDDTLHTFLNTVHAPRNPRQLDRVRDLADLLAGEIDRERRRYRKADRRASILAAVILSAGAIFFAVVVIINSI